MEKKRKSSYIFHVSSICGVLLDLIQFKKREKQHWTSDTFSKVAKTQRKFYMLLSLLEKLEPMNILQIVKQFSDHTFDLPFKYLNDKFYIFSRDSHLEAFCFPFVLLVEWQLKNDISSE